MTPFDTLSDDVLYKILLYCPFPSAVRFATGTCRSLRQRFDDDDSSQSWYPLWKTMYHRHGFCPPEEKEEHVFTGGNYVKLCREKRQLLSNLVLAGKKKKTTDNNNNSKQQRQRCHPFSLPNRFFSFLPIVPTAHDDDDMGDDEMMMMDPPPVFYECDSFVLTGCGTSPELLMLDPFDGSLRVMQNCLQHNNVARDEAMMEWAYMSAGNAIQQQYRKSTGAAIEDAVAKNHSRNEQQPSPSAQCLLGGDEYFELDISQFFPHYRPNDHHRRRTAGDEEFEMSFVGTEAKPIWNVEDGNCIRIEGYMVGLGRCVTSLDRDSVVCSELTTWTRSTTESSYGNRRVCRLPFSFNLLDMDPGRQRVFTSCSSGTSPDLSSKTISVYPLVDWQGEDASNNASTTSSFYYYFPQRLMSLECLHPVSTFILDATSQMLIVATTGGTLEVWKLSKAASHRQHSFGLLEKLCSSIHRELTRRIAHLTDGGQSAFIQRGDDMNHHHHLQQETIATDHHHHGDVHNNPNDDVSSRFSVLRRQSELPQFHAPIQSIFLPKHLPVERAGFVTLHYSRDEGSSLLVWKRTHDDDGDDSWEVVSLIHLRLTSRRRPRIAYDGNRILVFGEDHIGPIILVYEVRNLGGGECVSDFFLRDNDDNNSSGEASGGVYHLTYIPIVRFANRIRHVALGGIQGIDSMHMTSNERFLIVNTRAGNHLGSSPFSEGLLVIDLQDHRHHC